MRNEPNEMCRAMIVPTTERAKTPSVHGSQGSVSKPGQQEMVVKFIL